MADRFVLVFDGGTSNARSFVFNEKAQVVGCCVRPWSYATEDDASPLARAFDPQALWPTFCELAAGGLKDARISPREVCGVGVTTQRQAVVLLDEAGREISAVPNLDLRAVFEGAAIDGDMRDRVYRTTGHTPSFLFTPAKLRWFQIHRREAYDKIRCVLTLADWLVWRLTGALASELTLAGEAGLLDIHSREWCADLLFDMALASNSHPLVEAGTLAGHVNRSAASETGLEPGTPVAFAGADTQCGLLGMGIADENQMGIVAGWSAPVQMVTRHPVLSPGAKTWAGCFLSEGKWVIESSAGDLGNSYTWLANTLAGGGDNAFDEMEELAGKVPPGSEGAVTFLGPGRMDMASVGMRAGGLLFPVPLTFSDMDRGHLIRASLEAMAYALRANVDQIEELTGVHASAIALGGGMARTPTFARVLTDVLGRELKVSPVWQVSAVGACLCTRTALGEFASLEDAASTVRPSLQTLEPDPLDSALYQEQYRRWTRLSDKLQDLGL